MNAVVNALLWLSAVYGALALVLWVAPASWERLRDAQFRRESDRINGLAVQRRWTVSEVVSSPARWLANVAMWWAAGGRRG